MRLGTAMAGLAFVLGVAAVAAAEWTVPDGVQELSVQVQGKVAVVPGVAMALRPDCEGAVVTWICPRGTRARRGEVVVRFDTGPIQEKHARLQQELALQRQRQAARELELQAAIAASEKALATAVEQQAALDAEVREASAGDAELVARLRLEIDAARLGAETAELDLARQKQLLELGELARENLENAKLAATKAEQEVALSKLELAEAGDGSDPVAARRAVWAAERHRIKQGLDRSGQPIADVGVAAMLGKQRGRLERHRAAAAREESFKKLEIRLAEKAAWPHLPVRQLVIARADGTVVREMDFTADGSEAVYDAGAGHGFVTAPTWQRTPSALVIRGEAAWRCDLPPGTYQVRLVVGDDNPWSYVRAFANGTVLVAENTLSTPVDAAVEVAVGSAGLRLDLGLPVAGMLATQGGAIQRAWADVGEAVRSNAPAVYLAPDDKLVAELLVHHLQVPFFAAADGYRVELLGAAGDWVPAAAVKVNEEPAAFFPEAKGWRDMDEEEEPAEKTARAVRVAIPPEQARQFAIEAHVQCRATVTVAMPRRAVPAFLVAEDPTGLVVKRGGKRLSVTGVRYDGHFVLDGGVAPGDGLSLPRDEGDEAEAKRFPGEIVAAAKVPLIPKVRRWARIQKMLPHGSEVKEGDWVMTLYRPEQGSEQAMAKAKAAAAEGQFLQAVEARQTMLNQQRADLVDAVQEEKVMADMVAEHRTRDESEVASAREARRATEAELALMERQLAEIKESEATRLARERYARRREILRRQVLSRQLAAVASRRSTSYAALVKDQHNWEKARAELTTRESRIQLELKEQELKRQQSQRQLANQLENEKDIDDFEKNRTLVAPASGRVFYRSGYNDLTRNIQRLDENFVVWRGLTVAEILDVNQLALRVQLPEVTYRELAVGDELPISLDEFDDRLLNGRISEKGLQVYETSSRDNKQARDVFDMTKVFDATISFSVPADLRGKLKPGMRGAAVLP